MEPSSASILPRWNAQARGLLILVVAIGGVSLARVSRQTTGDPMALPILKVDVNTVPEPVLLALPGLGPTLARRIIEARALQPFRSLAEVDRRVVGIGPARAEGLRPYLRFDPPPIP